MTNPSLCSKCGGEGYIYYTDENGYDFRAECSCGLIERQRMQNRLRFANLPQIYADARLSDLRTDCYKTPEAKAVFISACKAIKFWLDNLEDMEKRGMGLYFFSNTKGSGKTRVAASLANELMKEKNIPVKFATSMQILDEIKATWDRQSGEYTSEHKLIDALSTARILIIDDFGTEKVKDWMSEKFYSIINGRYIDNKVTIFTSNLSLNDLRYDDRIMNRIKERVYMIPFPEESVREHIASNNAKELWQKSNENI